MRFVHCLRVPPPLCLLALSTMVACLPHARVPKGAICTSNDDCQSDLVCANHVCAPASLAFDGGLIFPTDGGTVDGGEGPDSGFTSDAGSDVDSGTPDDGGTHVPGACSSDADCAGSTAGHVCDPATSTCVGCTADAQCPAGQICNASHACIAKPCGSDDDCPTSFACVARPNSANTGFVESCQPANAGGKKGGEACTQDSDCWSNHCYFYLAGQTEGICIDGCNPSNNGAECGSHFCPSPNVLFWMPGPDGKYESASTSDDTWAAVSVCWPQTCHVDADCVGLSAVPSVPRSCAVEPADINDPTNDAKSVLYCLPARGVGRAEAPCSTADDCASGTCMLWTDPNSGHTAKACFWGCLADSDCPSQMCVETSFVADGTVVKTCAPPIP